MKKYTLFLSSLLSWYVAWSQTTPARNSADILLGLQKLKVLGSVLYIAAHPDDENTRLLAYFSKEKLYRTGYLSITRGDGGQNLIGDEQGIELGLIRTQELLAARRIDGAEQFFTRAYDFGYSKSTEEAMKIWDKDKILADVVWVIRKFQPDVIITRFPEDSRAGHGQHSGSSVLAREAFAAAADPSRYPEQFNFGVSVWQAKRLLWNTFNFGSTNTTSENQFKVDVGVYNPLLGKSYGELAAESRSQHKSQGFGVPSSRGSAIEYFSTLAGDAPKNDLFDGVSTNWDKVPGSQQLNALIESIISNYAPTQPDRSVPALVKLYQAVLALPNGYWKEQKLSEIQKLVEACSGLYMEASTNQEYAVQGDSLRINFSINNRAGSGIDLKNVQLDQLDTLVGKSLGKNVNLNFSKTIAVPYSKPLTQPYWLSETMLKGSFVVRDQELIGKPQNGPAYEANFKINVEGQEFEFRKPVQYKHTDPVKGELFQPLIVVPQITVTVTPPVIVFPSRNSKNQFTSIYRLFTDGKNLSPQLELPPTLRGMLRGSKYTHATGFDLAAKNGSHSSTNELVEVPIQTRQDNAAFKTLNEIEYDHIPAIKYFTDAKYKALQLDIHTDGKKIAYIKGAGDKMPEALQQLGYSVNFLEEKDVVSANLRQFDAVITGVRAYNVHEWLNSANEALNDYVKNGGNLVVQYNTIGFAGPARFKTGPYPFVISRNRVTDEDSKVNFINPNDIVLNWPNKISAQDFEGWIQERGIYFAEQLDSNYKAILAMKDPGEEEQKGSLVVGRFGKGRYIYTGLAFFRQLPAGVPGAYRLFANLIANPNSKNNGTAKQQKKRG